MNSESQPKNKPSILKASGIFAGSNFISMFLRIIGGILTSRCIDPAMLGLYNGIGLVGGYVPFLQLGVINGLNRDLAISIGAGKENLSRRLTAAAQYWALIISCVLSFSLLLVAIWHAVMGNYDLAAGWLSHSINIFGIIFVTSFLETVFRASSDFTTLAAIRLTRMIAAVLLVAFVYWFGWYGLCVRGALIAVIGLGLMWYKRPIRVKSSFDMDALKQLVKTGIPIFIVGYVFSLWTTLNATLVLAYMGKIGLGLYTVANLTGPAIALLTRALGQVIYPKLAAEFGSGKKVRELVKLSVLPILFGVFVTSAGAVIAWFLLPPVVEIVLPKYVEGIKAAQWAVVASAVLAFGPINNLFNVLKKQGRYGVAIVTGMLVYVGVLFFLMADGADLTDFPKALVVGRGVFLLVSYSMIAHLVFQDERAKQ